ncbi:MAG: DUF6510 family protein [Leifsonia flava]
MTHLDGNSLAGVLSELFRFDPTTASARCAGCGTIDVLARAMVWEGTPGTVVRCASCDNVLATIVESDDKLWLNFSGITAVEVRR